MKIGNLEVYGIIYKVENLINGKVYIGQTTQGYNRRYCVKGKGVERIYKRHKMFKECGYDYNKHLLDSIEKYGIKNFTVNEILDCAFSEYELNIKEKCWIQYYNSYKNGYNYTTGGEGSFGHNGMKRKNNPASRSVVQLSMMGEFIKQWDCMQDAADILGVTRTKIGSVCRNTRRSAGGFLWVYTEDYDPNKDYCCTKKRVSKPVVMLDKNYNYIDEYNNIKEASIYNPECNTCGINKCCVGLTKTHKGFIFMYKHDYLNRIIKTS